MPDAIWKVRILLMYEMGMPHENVMLHFEEEVDSKVMENFQKHIQEIANGKPLQYITHTQEFYGLDFYVDENVLIPQPDTERLVEEIIHFSTEDPKSYQILDICTGSGAIAIALAKHMEAKIMATDISPEALEIAKKNAQKHAVLIKFCQSDLFGNVNETFDIIVSNPPYIETKTIQTLPLEVQNEPILALDGGEDGLEFYRKLVQKAGEHLNQNGRLVVEIGYNQKEKVIEIFEKAGFCEIYSKKDYANQDRMIVGKWRK